jgi:hypothetical protein
MLIPAEKYPIDWESIIRKGATVFLFLVFTAMGIILPLSMISWVLPYIFPLVIFGIVSLFTLFLSVLCILYVIIEHRWPDIL